MFKKLNEQIDPLIPEAVLFDTDNTLYNYEPANRKATNAIAKKIKNILDINKHEFLTNYMSQDIKIRSLLQLKTKPPQKQNYSFLRIFT